MRIRLYQQDDLATVIGVYTAAIRGLAAPYYSTEQLAAWAPIPADEDRWRERLATLHTLVAEERNEVAGFASYTAPGYVDFLFTHPAFARRGVATHLYQAVEWALDRAGVTEVTTLASLAGRPFFERQGFAVLSEEDALCRGVSLRRFAMRKTLVGERREERLTS